MRLPTAGGVTVLLTFALLMTPAWAGTSDDQTLVDLRSADPSAWPGSDPDNPDMPMPLQSTWGTPMAEDFDCLVVRRYTRLSDAEREIDPEQNVAWVASDAEREPSEKCRSLGAR